MTGNNCPHCGKKCPNKLSAKKHKKLCTFIPVVEIKAEANETDLVKLINPYGESFPNLEEDDPSHDVTIVSSDGSLMTCHAAVLAASSTYLADVLEDACREDDNVLIVAQNVHVEQMKNLLDFLYRGKIRASKEEVNDIKILLEEFQILFNIDIMDVKRENVQGVETIEDINELSEEITEDVDMIKEEYTVNGFSGDDDEDYEPAKKIKKQDTGKISQKKRGRPKKEDILKRKKALAARKLKREELKSICDYCELKSKSLKDTMKHVQETHPDVFVDFAEKYIQTSCQYCEKKFLSKELLYLHKRESHPQCLPTGQRLLYNINDGLPYTAQRQCPHCPRILMTIERYKDHVESHISGSDQPFACQHCVKKFSRSTRLRTHSKKHEISKTPLLCNLCGSTFRTEFDYDEHNKSHIKEAKLESPKEKKLTKPKPIDPNFSAVCSICGRKFTKKSKYDYHTKNAHVEEDKLRKCPLCPQTFTIFNAYDCHMKLHLPPTLECKHCPKKFPTPHYLKRHIRSQHMADNMKDFVCNQCGKGFNIKDAYIGHLNMHAGLKPYKCRYCEMCYQNTSNRIAHEKSRHPDIYVRRSEFSLCGVPIKKRQPVITPNT